MKRVIIATIFASVAAAMFAQASVGVILGEPTGLSAKLQVSDSSAFDAALAWSFLGVGAIYVHVDYLQQFDQFDVDPGTLGVYAGVGARVYVGGEVVIGGRVPVGLVYEFQKAPIEIFLELAPGLNLFPQTYFNVGGGLGVRYRL